MISLGKSLRFSFQPVTFILGFIWMSVYAVFVLCLMKWLLNSILHGDNIIQMLQTMYSGDRVYSIVSGIGIFLTFMYVLIIAKKRVYENPPNFSLSFFFRKSAVLFPCFAGYWMIASRLFGLFFVDNIGVKIGGGLTFVLLSYLFWAFVASYLEHFSFDSVRRLFIPVLKKPLPIVLLWVYGIGYGILVAVLTRYLALFTRAVLRDLLPELLPCGAMTAVLTFAVFGFVLFRIFKVLNRKGQVLMLLSFSFVIPSLIFYYILHSVIPLPINLLMFLLVFQILWYWVYFCMSIAISVLTFWAHLLAQVSREISSDV